MKIRIFGTPLLAWMAALVFAACSGELDDEKELAVGTSASALTISGGDLVELDTSIGISSRTVFLFGPATHVLETRNCSTGTDSVMHLMRNGAQVAYNDDGGDGFHSRISLQLQFPGNHVVILRSFGDGSNGTCGLYHNNSFLGTFATGGKRTDLTGVRAGEVLETVDNGSGAHQLLLLNGTTVIQSVSGGGLGNAARMTVQNASSDTLRAIVGSTAPTKLVRNDLLAGHDPDGDGLGQELELAIGTCSRIYGVVQGFDCGWLKDAKDTDADGLSDAWEVLGKGGSGPVQRLPMWGANPRHKDLFIEVDFRRRSFSDGDLLMQPDVARAVAEIYAGTLSDPDQAVRDHIAATLKNPDGLPGIALHFDTGMDPVDPADEYLYGDWGGHNPVPPASEGTGQSASAAYASHMHSSRKGVFRYLLGEDSGGGGSCAERVAACIVPLRNYRIVAHEFGHTLGLGHSGPSYGDTADPNCKPNYPSIMNYAYNYENDVGFANGLGLPILDNANLDERGASSATSLMMTKFANDFGFIVEPTQGWVDWNRDGSFSSNPVTANINYRTNTGGCEYTRMNKVYVGAQSSAAPALVRAHNYLYAFYRSSSGTLAYRYSNDSLDCPSPTDGCNGMTWYSGSAIGGDVEAVDAVRIEQISQYILVTTVDATGTLTARWFYPHGGGVLEELFPSVVLSEENVRGAPSLAVLPDGSIVVAYTVGDTMYTRRWLDTTAVWGPAALAQFSGTAPVVAQNASPAIAWVTVPASNARLISDYVEGLYAAIPAGTSSRISLYRYDEATDRWSSVSPWEGVNGPVAYGRPSMAFVPGDTAIGRAPRFYLYYQSEMAVPPALPTGNLSWMQSYATGSGWTLQHNVGLGDDFDNTWFDVFGHDALFEAGIDTNVRLLTAKSSTQLDFRPQADGLASHKMIHWNDWEVLGTETCLRTAESSSSNPVTCHDWRWSPGQITSHVRVKSAPEYCVHKQLNDTNNGNPLHLWTCRSGGDQMRIFTWDRTNGHINSSDGGNLCWHKERGDWLDGQAVHLWNCNSGFEVQKSWDYEPETGLIRARFNPSMCVVKETSSNTNGVDLVLRSCDAVATGDKSWELY